MLLWLMNMGFAGGSGTPVVVPPDNPAAKKRIPRWRDRFTKPMTRTVVTKRYRS